MPGRIMYCVLCASRHYLRYCILPNNRKKACKQVNSSNKISALSSLQMYHVCAQSLEPLYKYKYRNRVQDELIMITGCFHKMACNINQPVFLAYRFGSLYLFPWNYLWLSYLLPVRSANSQSLLNALPNPPPLQYE